MVLMLVLVFTHLHRGDTITAAITVDLLTAAIGVELQGECNLCSIIRAGSKPLKIIFMVMNEKEKP